jgi:uncharacterized membrane protein
MVTIAETIDIDVPVGTARAAWNAYVTGMIVGSGGRLAAPDVPVRWRRTEREADDGAVQFAMESSHVTRMTLALEYDPATEHESDPRRIEELHHQLYTDLHQFKDYAEARERKAS